MNIEERNINDLISPNYNPRRKLTPADSEYQKIKRSIEQFGYVDPIIVNVRTGNIVGGNQRWQVLKDLGHQLVQVVEVDLDDANERALNVALNKISGEWDEDKLTELMRELESLDFDLSFTGFDTAELDELLVEAAKDRYLDYESGSIIRDYVITPLSYLDTRQGHWQNRKREWIERGIQSEEGRDKNLAIASDDMRLSKTRSGTSIFDPVLCELMLKWFNVPNGNVFDPFAGGSVRGIVSHMLGHSYIGIDLRQEQIDANYKQAESLGISSINWICDNSLNLDSHIEDGTADMILMCPPYFDLEEYSDDPNDLSNMSYEEFCMTYTKILQLSANKLRDNRFAVVVISDVRDDDGNYRGLTTLTRQALENIGLKYYNDMVLLNTIGTAGLRVRSQMRNRKVIRSHQNIMIFFKGDVKQIKTEFPEIKFEESLEE